MGGASQNTSVIRWASSPVRVLLQHLVDADAEGLVIEALVDEILIYPELGGGDRLALWDPRQVKSELFVMPPHRQELLIVLHCQRETEKSLYVQFLEVAGGLQGLFCEVVQPGTPGGEEDTGRLILAELLRFISPRPSLVSKQLTALHNLPSSAAD